MGGQRYIQLCLAALVLAGSSAAARAQSRFSWQLHGGSAIPLSAYVHSGFRVGEAESGVMGQDQIPRLVDQYANLGFHVGTTVLLDQIEIRYMFHRFTWDREEVSCMGTSGLEEVRPGEFDDALVDYACSNDGPLSTEPVDATREPVLLHVISVGYRVLFLEDNETLELYVGGAPGLAISSYNDDPNEDGAVFGFNLGVGSGLDISLSTAFSIGVEVRYNLLLTPPPSSLQAAANRATALHQSSAQAVLNAFHYTELGLGLHLNFR